VLYEVYEVSVTTGLVVLVRVAPVVVRVVVLSILLAETVELELIFGIEVVYTEVTVEWVM